MTEAPAGADTLGSRSLTAVVIVAAASLAGAAAGAVAVLLWAGHSGTPMRELGFRHPPNWLRVLAEATAFGIALRLALEALVMPLLGAPAVNTQYSYVAGNAAALPGIVATVLLAGVTEELVYRGFVFERLRAFMGPGPAVVRASVIASAVLFALAHYRDQGALGVAQSAITGLVFAATFAWRQHIWFPIVAHVAFNLTSVMLIYGSWEEAVARALLG
ncbi:MAG: CPBP family intramembrane metalloprotease [Gemmatimonadetes bacterium]|nr:CPBP family intramembrane metalloprotease [Gemmatimonadota bacterium]